MKLVPILFFVTVLFGCSKKYFELYKADSSLLTPTDNTFVFENDSLKVTYSFWESKGIMAFSILNKLDNPLYIDWKKSGYILGGKKFDYWVESEIVKGNSTSLKLNEILAAPFLSQSQSVIVKPERITFIPPKTFIVKAQHNILSQSPIDWTRDFKRKEVSNDLREKTRIKYKEFDEISSPVSFRNYLTFSYDESMKPETHTDHTFFVKEVQLIESMKFMKDSTDKKWRKIRVYRFSGGKDFFLEL